MKKRVQLNLKTLRIRLEEEVHFRNSHTEISLEKPDPLLIARAYNDEYIALLCALFSYGNVRAIIHFLRSLDFSLLHSNEEKIRDKLHVYYRFQTVCDVQEIFITLSRLKQQNISLEALFHAGYQSNNDVMQGLKSLIEYLYDTNSYRSKGYQFLLGNIAQSPYKSTYKRWHMYLRWMVRSDCLDLGLWRNIATQDLLVPLDVHTFTIGKKIGLITQKSYDFKAVLELTNALKQFDPSDPVKYDFALYRIGQEKLFDKGY